MADDQYRVRTAVDQQRRQRRPDDPGKPGKQGGEGATSWFKRKRGLLLGAVALIAAGVVGTQVIPSSGSAAGQFSFEVITDPQQVLDYVHQQHLPPAKTQQLEEQVKKQELVIWNVTQNPGWSGQQGQTYSMDNGIDRYQFVVQSQGQHFGVLAEKSTPGFTFSADSDPPGTRMTGKWYTPAGTTGFDMHTGQTMVIKVH
jgi:hypothetical protein